MTKRAALLLAGISVAVVICIGAVTSLGLQFYKVETPSMGTTAPVGSLVVTCPAPTYEVGDIVSYVLKGRTYTHRIVATNSDGTFVTQGDLNDAADAFPVAATQMVGKAVWIAPGLGWLWQALPWLLIGGLISFGISLIPYFEHPWQWVVRISGWTLTLCAVTFWLHPWVSLSQLGWTPTGIAGVDMHVVNTGIFPLDVLGNRLISGQDAVVHVTEQNARGEYTLTPGLAFHWWEQVIVLLLCLLPMTMTFLIRAEQVDHNPSRAVTEEPDSAAAAQTRPEPKPQSGRGRMILIAAVVVAVVIGVAVVTLNTTSAALTAKVTNATNTVGTRTFFNCTNAVTSSSGSPYLAWAMGTEKVTKAADLNGSTAAAKVGTFANSTALGTATTGTTTVGCNNDAVKASIYFDGAQCLSTGSTISNPQTFSLEAWFWTPTKPNGKIIGFGNTQGGSDTTYDRHVYIDDAGRLVFGTYNGGFQVIASPAGTSYADSKWHNVIATFSASTGMKLYIDGALVASNTSYTAAENTTGYWKAGCGNLGGSWPNAAGSASWSSLNYFKGQIQFAAVYSAVLTATQAKEHYQAGLA